MRSPATRPRSVFRTACPPVSSAMKLSCSMRDALSREVRTTSWFRTRPVNITSSGRPRPSIMMPGGQNTFDTGVKEIGMEYKILIADDNAELVKMLRTFFELRKCIVIAAENGGLISQAPCRIIRSGKAVRYKIWCPLFWLIKEIASNLGWRMLFLFVYVR